jgi:hypothetical protein
MAEKIYKTLAEIDADLDTLFDEKSKEELTEQENTADEPAEVETKAPTQEADTNEDAEEAPVPEEPKKPIVAEPAKDNKQDYAFKQLREEANAAKKQAASLEASLQELDELAQAQGFKNHKEFLSAWKDKRVEEEARQRNIDPKVLKELNDTKSRLSKIEQEKKTAEQQAAMSRINSTIDKFASKYKLDESAVQQILNNMGKDNVTIESLILTPPETLEKMLNGYAQDTIVERKVQERLASLEANGNSPAPEKHKNTTSAKKAEPFSKEALDSEMEAFKKQNYPWLK